MEALADASFLVALHFEDDVHHGRAREVLKRVTALLWNPISFVETHFHMARDSGTEAANERWGLFASSVHARFVPLGEQDLVQALSLAKRHRLTTNDAVMASHAMRLKVPVLTFDDDFRRVEGLEVVPQG